MRTLLYPLLASILVCSASSVFCQEAAQKHISVAAEQIKAQNYIAAYEELDKARNETMKLVSTQLEKVFPATVNNWTLIKDPMGMMPATMPGRNISINKSYELAKEPAKEPAKTRQDSMAAPMATQMQPRIMVTISNDSFSVNHVNMMYTNATAPKDTSAAAKLNAAPMAAMGAMPGEEVKAVTIKNFKAITRLHAQMKVTSISIVAGKGTVQLHGMQVETLEPLMKVAEAIDLNKIAETFGKK